MSLLFAHFSVDPPYSFSSLTWPLTAHFFSNFFFLLCISPWTPTPFPGMSYAPLCFVSLLWHCSLQVRQKLHTFAEDFLKFCPHHKWGDTFASQAVLFSREYCSHHFKQTNRASDTKLFCSSDHNGLHRNREVLLHAGSQRGLLVVDYLYSVAHWVSLSPLLTLGKACLITLLLQFTLHCQAVRPPVSTSIYTDLTFLAQRVLCTTGPFRVSFCKWRSLHHQSLAWDYQTDHDSIHNHSENTHSLLLCILPV